VPESQEFSAKLPSPRPAPSPPSSPFPFGTANSHWQPESHKKKYSRRKWRQQFFVGEFFPINAFHPRMILDFVNAIVPQSAFLVSFKEAVDKINALRIPVCR
jgi:hypothetical protein